MGKAPVGPLLQALEGHMALEEVFIRTIGGVREECLCIALVHMASLRRCSLYGLGRCSKEAVALEVEAMPSLTYLSLDRCGLEVLPLALLMLPSLEGIRVNHNSGLSHFT